MTPPVFPDIRAHIAELMDAARSVVAPAQSEVVAVIERPKQAEHGDFACNLAMQLAKPLRRNPRDIATALIAAMPASPHIAKTEIAGAGFINIFLKPKTQRAIVPHILAKGAEFGRAAATSVTKIQVEFVSANPTGPLHVGHGRGAAFGASLANVLVAAGFDVQREYYVNDAGRQMDILAVSTWLRYLELADVRVPFPPNAYQGDYVIVMAQALRARDADCYVRSAADVTADMSNEADAAEANLDQLIANAKRLLGAGYAAIHAHVLKTQLDDCRADLAEFGVFFDCWYSEQSLYDSGKITRAVGRLEKAGHLYEKDGATWFRSTAFGDEKDRVVRRENGQYTYFASDIAYHLDKLERGFSRVIDVWGADHHGYIPRVKGALAALDANPAVLEIALVQFAVLYRGENKVSMSTRAGEFVTLRELRSEVGNDAARFFYVLRKSDQHLDFDLDLAKSQSNENPVYYVQYAHARVCSVLEQWEGEPAGLNAADPSALTAAPEAALLSRLAEYPVVIENAARELSPHLIAFYLRELAAEFHSYYNGTRLLVPEEPVKLARLALAVAIRQVLRNGLALLGVSAPEKM
ncbi:MAG: arginine--tRNA ligase [Betaproteobacteria bacterium]|nr:arginine--tRNA ligase [Betaproteobacteria bacterium]